MDRAKMHALVERYGDDPIAVIKNGLLGVARKRKLKGLKPEEKKAQVEALVDSWIAAMQIHKGSIVSWLVSKI